MLRPGARGLRRHNTATAAAARRPRARRTTAAASSSSSSSVDAREIDKFANPTEEWWGDEGDATSSAGAPSSVGPLRSMNPVRSQFIRRWTDAHFGRDSALRGARVLDVGCGGGLLSETLAQLGCQVVGLDASSASIKAAQEHYHRARGDGDGDAGTINYVHSTIEDFIRSGDAGEFDVVCALEVIEHVPRDCQHRFVFDCRSLVKPGGCMFVSTMNRTARALALAVFGAEVVLRMVPTGPTSGEVRHPRGARALHRNGSMVGGLGKPKA